MKRKFSILFAALAAILLITPPHFITKAQGENDATFFKVTDASTLKAGDIIYIVCDSKGTAAGDISSSIMASVNVSISNSNNSLPFNEDVVELTLGGSSGSWTLSNNEGKLLGATAAKKLAWDKGTTTWSISIQNGNATIQNGTSKYGRFLYNVNDPRFTTYTSNTSASMLLPQIYRKSYTLLYDSNGGEGTMLDPNSPYPIGNTVTVLDNNFTYNGYSFVKWNTAADGTGTDYNAGDQFALNENTTLYAQWTAAGDYILVSPSTKFVTCEAQTVEFDITTNITEPSYNIQFYTSSEFNETLDTKPEWIGENTFNENKLQININDNTGAERYAYFKITNAETYSNGITLHQEKNIVATPQFNPESGTVLFNQGSITLSCATEGATIYYTLDGTDPSTESMTYDTPITINETKTIKAIAVKENISSDIASAEFTIVTPLTTMQQIFDEAEETSQEVYITFNNWIISHTSTRQAFLTDGKKGCIIYNDNGHNFNTNDVLSGTVLCEIKNYHGAAEIVGLYNLAEGLTVTQNGNIDPVVKTIGELNAINTGQKVKFEYLTYNNETLTDGTNTISIITNSTLKNGKQYDVTGVFCFDNTGNNKIYSQEEIGKAYIDYSKFDNLTQFSYVLGNGPSEAQQIQLSGENIEDGLTILVSEKFELRLGEEGEYSNTISIPGTEILDNLYIRLKGDLEIGEYQGTLSFTANNLQTKEIGLTGVVAESEIYNIIIGTHENGVILADKQTSKAGETITLTNTPNAFYQFISWNVVDKNSNPIEVVDNKFIMPESDVTVNAVFERIQYQITFSVNGNTESIAPRNYNAGEATALPTESEITVPEGFNFVGWSLSNSEPEIISSLTPTQDVTLYAVFSNQDQYVRVTQNLGTDWAGRYLIAYNDNTFANGQIGGKEGIGKAGVKVDLSTYISNNTIPSNIGDQYYVELEEITPGINTYVLKTQDGQYNYQTTNSNGLSSSYNKSTADEYPITVSFISENEINLCLGGNAAGAVFRYNNNTNNGLLFRFYRDCGQQAVYLYKKTIGRYYTRVISQNEVATGDIVIENPTIIPSGSVLDMGEHTITSTDPNNLIIEDGGQLIVNNSGVMATFKKSIEATPTAKTTGGGWYSIASPVNNVAISSVTNLVDNADHSLRYNLYRYYEPSSVWQAYNTINHADFTTLANGQGYLYRNNGMELSFSGEVNHGEVVVNLTNSATNTELKGFNLIGNPFGHNIYKGSGAAIDNNNLSEGFYYLTYNGEWQAGDGSKAITPKMGVLVQVTGEAFELTISDNNSQPNTRYANDNLQFIVSNNEYQDVAYAKFSKGYGLNKISHRNSEVPMLYIPQNGERYAIAMMSDNTEMFSLNFKAATMGRYTLSYKAEGEFSYLHVIDRLTGDDVDMLLEGEYSFTASPKDNESRFIVRLAYKPDYSNEGNEMFVYQNGDEILVSGEGELQVFDATGRLVRNMSINGAKSLNISTQGVYVFRLVGNEVKTQKIVVR